MLACLVLDHLACMIDSSEELPEGTGVTSDNEFALDASGSGRVFFEPWVNDIDHQQLAERVLCVALAL